MDMKLYQPVLFVGLGGTGCRIGVEFERGLRDAICGPDGRGFSALRGRGSMLPFQLPNCFQFVYADTNDAELGRLVGDVVPGPEHEKAVPPTAQYVTELMPNYDSYPKLAMHLRMKANAVVQDWLPPKTEDEPPVAPLQRGAGQFPTIGRAALYGTFHDHYEQLQGKELSYNNILDITSATYLIGEFERPTVAILKHTNPCGLGSAETLVEAWEKAYATDRQAPFGGVIVVNRTMDGDLAALIADIFTEVIIAPRFGPEALAILGRKKNLRLMVAKEGLGADALQEIRSVVGGVLVQDRDRTLGARGAFRVVTRRQPTEGEWDAMLFGWKVCKHVKSNAIVYCRGEQTLGIGAGQMARVDSSRVAVWKAGEAGLDLRGSVVVSEALFPFADGLVAAADAGATAAIQPGGSMRDDEVIKAADERGMAMVFTGIRHFRH